MSQTVFMRHVLGSLRPIDTRGEEEMRTLKPDEVVSVTWKRPRNLKFHKKFFALLGVLFPHQDIYPTMEMFRAAVTVALGFSETITLPDKRKIVIPRSISFGSMDKDEFEQLMKRFFVLAETKILPGIDRDDVRREYEAVLAGYEREDYYGRQKRKPDAA